MDSRNQFVGSSQDPHGLMLSLGPRYALILEVLPCVGEYLQDIGDIVKIVHLKDLQACRFQSHETTEGASRIIITYTMAPSAKLGPSVACPDISHVLLFQPCAPPRLWYRRIMQAC